MGNISSVVLNLSCGSSLPAVLLPLNCEWSDVLHLVPTRNSPLVIFTSYTLLFWLPNIWNIALFPIAWQGVKLLYFVNRGKVLCLKEMQTFKVNLHSWKVCVPQMFLESFSHLWGCGSDFLCANQWQIQWIVLWPRSSTLNDVSILSESIPTQGGTKTFSVTEALTCSSSENRAGFQNCCTNAPIANCHLLAGVALTKEPGGEKEDKGRQNKNWFTSSSLPALAVFGFEGK